MWSWICCLLFILINCFLSGALIVSEFDCLFGVLVGCVGYWQFGDGVGLVFNNCLLGDSGGFVGYSCGFDGGCVGLGLFLGCVVLDVFVYVLFVCVLV